MIKNVRDLLGVLFMPFFIIWLVAIAFMVKYLDLDTVSALGLGTATGVFLKAFSDMWQFYYRKRGDDPK